MFVLCFHSNSEEENAKRSDVGHTKIGSKTSGTSASAKLSSQGTDDSEVGLAADSGHASDSVAGEDHDDSIDKSVGYRRSNRRRNISAKIDLDELNMHSGLRSLYGTRTDSERRCPKGPCPCGVSEEVTEAEVENGDKQAELAVAHAHKGPCACDLCGKVLPDRQRLEQHMNTHPGDDLIHCDVCGRGFALVVHLNRHMKTHVADRPFTCDHCGASYAEKGFLDMHMIAHQPESEKETAMKMAAAKTRPDSYRCRRCNETFSTRWRLRKHNTEKHRTRPALKTTPNSRCTCPICGKSLSYRLSVHMRVHTGERPYKCTTCSKAFYQRSSLRSHLSTHTGVKTHTCAECGKSFRLRALLRQHMRKHVDDLRHECPLCGKRFWVPTLLRDHLLLHTGERPFQCATCGRKYRLRKELTKHERLHLGEVATRCEVCGLETTSLKRHMQVHTGEKPYSCEQCGKAFRRKEHLRVHCSRVHNVEIPKREKVQAISLDSCLIKMQNEVAETINADDCGLTLVIGDSVVV